MTDKTPAMPELPEPELGYIETDKSKQPAFSARQMRVALQSAQPAEVSDESAYNLIDRFLRNNLHDDDYAEYSQALDILALRPQAVPSLDTLKQHLACDIECSVYENTVLPAIERWECHHGITAQGAQGEQA